MPDLPDSPERVPGSAAPLPPPVPGDLLEAAATMMDREDLDVAAAAAHFELPPEVLHRYYRARTRFSETSESPEGAAEESGTAAETAAKLPSLRESGKHLDSQEVESFQENWDRRARLEPAVRTPSPAARFCSRFPLLRWLVRDGELDPAITAGTAILLGSGIAVGIAAASGAFSSEPPATPTEPASSAAPAPVSLHTAKAKEVITRFLAAPDVAAKRPFMRNPDTDAPLLEKRLAQGQESLPSAFKYLFFEELIEYSGKRFLLFSGLDEVDSGPIHLIVDATAEPYTVDWQASIAYQPMEWDAFLHSRPPGDYPFRVFASISDSYESGFEDQKLHLALSLTTPTSSQPIQTYVARDSDLGRKIATTFLIQGKTAQSIARLFPILTFDGIPDGEERVTVKSLVAEDWMVP